ncbi:MAG: MOSC domain-containing protein [Planctomycetes bacterium]|nr:MOSC domain-containing protein [Planctomycetota bacterium]
MSETTTIEGTILAVCIGPGGIPKHAVPEARATSNGLVGDKQRFRMHGGAKRALCLFSSGDYASLRRDGVACEQPGSFGENVLVEGIDFKLLLPLERLALGDEVEIELHDVREPCGTLKSVDARFPNLMLGRSGFVCRVLREGLLRPGMRVRRA